MTSFLRQNRKFRSGDQKIRIQRKTLHKMARTGRQLLLKNALCTFKIRLFGFFAQSIPWKDGKLSLLRQKIRSHTNIRISAEPRIEPGTLQLEARDLTNCTTMPAQNRPLEQLIQICDDRWLTVTNNMYCHSLN